MALPPTKIYKYIKDTPEETKKALRRVGLLNRSAVKNNQIVRDIKQAVYSYHNSKRSETTGPNEDDITAECICRHLSIMGVLLSRTPEYDPPLSFRLCVPFIKVYGRIKSLFY